MIMWIILIVFALFLILVIKSEHHLRKIKLAIILIALILIYFSVVTWFNSDQIDLSSPGGIVNAVYVYFGWVGETGNKIFGIGKDTFNAVGDVIKTNQTEKKKIDDGRI